VTYEAENLFYSKIRRGISSIAEQKNIVLVARELDSTPIRIDRNDMLKKQREKILELSRSDIDAYIICPITGTKKQDLEPILSQNKPVIVIDEDVLGQGAERFPEVVFDNRRAARMGVNYLTRRMRLHGIPKENLALVAPLNVAETNHSRVANERITGYKEQLRDLSLPTQEIEGDFRLEQGYINTKRWLENIAKENASKPVAALFSVNDLTTKGCILACVELGLRIGFDIFLCAIDDVSDLSDIGGFIPRISYASQNGEEMGRYAMEFALKRLDPNMSPNNNTSLENIKVIEPTWIDGHSGGELLTT
jgi:DNA-binding LacI/PurR family transcriptional regulator